jgi:phosphotransferase family enzyme
VRQPHARPTATEAPADSGGASGGVIPAAVELEQRAVEILIEGLRGLERSPTWLFAVGDHELVEAELVRWVPELVSGELNLRACRVSKLRVSPGSLTAVYHLTVEAADSKQGRVLELLGEIVPPGRAAPKAGSQGGPIGTDEWRCYLPELRMALRTKPTDVALPILPVLTDPEAARAILERGIRGGSNEYADFRIHSCAPAVVRYKPGRRCTVVYDLEFPAECRGRGWPNPVVAKTHHGTEGRNAYEGMKALWRSRLRFNSAVTIAEPLAFLPREKLLLQGPVPRQLTLEQLIESSLSAGGSDTIDALSEYIRKTAVGLAELHTCGVRYGDPLTWHDQLAEIQGRISCLAELKPELANATRPLLRRLHALIVEHPAGRLVPAHRSLRPDQVLIHNGEIGFIDFDGFCQAEPAVDLGLFRATFKDVGLRALRSNRAKTAADREDHYEQVAQVEHLCEVFLARYEAIAPVSRVRVAMWEALALLSLVLNCWLKVKPQRLEHRLELLSHHLRTSGLC